MGRPGGSFRGMGIFSAMEMPLLAIFEDGTFDLTAEQYLGIGIIVASAVFAQALYVAIATLYIRHHAEPGRRKFWRNERRRLDRVILGLFLAIAMLIGVPLLDLDTEIEDTAIVAARVLGAVCGGLILLRGIAIVGDYLFEKAEATETRLDDQLIPMIRQTANVFVVVVGTLFVLSNLDVNVGALIAGLGIGGIAVALAAQDSLRNLFGGIMILADRPFQVGDWIIIGDVEGTVEKVGFRSMRIRKFGSSLVTIPNARVTDTNIDNMGLRQYRRYDTTLHLPLDTPPEVVQAFCEGVRALLRANTLVRQDYYFCELERIGDSTLDVLLYCFFAAPDWNAELRAKHILNLDILRLANSLGVTLAAPASTVRLDGWLGGTREKQPPAPTELAATINRFGTPGGAGQAAHTTITEGYEPEPELVTRAGPSDDGE